MDWDNKLIDRLGSARGLDESARAAGALLRRGGVGSAAVLLRVCFASVLGGLSRRRLSAWAEERALASLSEVGAAPTALTSASPTRSTAYASRPGDDAPMPIAS